MKTIFLAEGEKHVRESLRLMIEQQAGVKILGEARSVESLLAQVCQQAPDAIMLDWNLPGIHHQRLIQTLHECCPASKLVALSVKPEDERSAKEYGMDGFISKQLPAESFMVSLCSILSMPGSKKENSRKPYPSSSRSSSPCAANEVKKPSRNGKLEITMKTSIVNEVIPSRQRTDMGTKTLASFLALTFGLSWIPMSLFMLFADQLTPLLGEMSSHHPFFLLAVYAPGISGMFLVWRHYGLTGLGSFFRRLTLWRAPLQWWLFLLLGIPLIVYAAAALSGTIDDPFSFSPWVMVFPALVQSLMLGPLGEEFGWRGLALPLLQRRFAPFWASLLLGVVWAIWHAPAFLLSGTPQSAWSFGPFFIGLIAITIIMTPLFNASRGSLLIASLYHLQIMNPIFPDAQPWDSYLLAIVAAIIVFLNRRQMFQRGTGVLEVLGSEDKEQLTGQS